MWLTVITIFPLRFNLGHQRIESQSSKFLFFRDFLDERKLISFFFFNFWGLGMRVEALILESQHADRGPAQVSREFFFLFHAPPFRICPASRGKSIPGFIVRVCV